MITNKAIGEDNGVLGLSRKLSENLKVSLIK